VPLKSQFGRVGRVGLKNFEPVVGFAPVEFEKYVMGVVVLHKP